MSKAPQQAQSRRRQHMLPAVSGTNVCVARVKSHQHCCDLNEQISQILRMFSSSFIYTMVVWFEFTCRVATYVMLILMLEPRFIRTVEALPTNIDRPIMVAMVSEDLLKSQLLKSHLLFDSSSRPPTQLPTIQWVARAEHPHNLARASDKRSRKATCQGVASELWWKWVGRVDMMDMRMLIDGW